MVVFYSKTLVSHHPDVFFILIFDSVSSSHCHIMFFLYFYTNIFAVFICHSNFMYTIDRSRRNVTIEA